MTRIPWAAAAALFSAALSFGQSPSVILQNEEDSPFYYVMDPAELSGLTAGSPLLASRVAGYFATPGSGPTFSRLAPQQDIRLADLAAGSHLLVGFFEVSDSDMFPVRVMAVQADPSVPDRFYSIFSATAQLTVRRGVGKLAAFGPPSGTSSTATASTGSGGSTPAASAAPPTGPATTAPAAAVEGTVAPATAPLPAAGGSLPTLASFSASYNPVVFTRETKNGFSVLPIAQARSWTQTGTRITAVQGLLDNAGLKLSLSVPGGFSPSVSYFLYVFDSRTAGQDNSLTLEIEPLARGDRGACILWQQGSSPRLIGTVKTEAESVELDVSHDELASSPLASVGASATVDLTAGWYDRALGMWEEFYYTTLPVTR